MSLLATVTATPAVILPTHTCFDDALDLCMALARQSPTLRYTLYLVHGICIAPDGEHYAHAWVEDGPWCLFTGIYEGSRQHFQAARAEYYADLQITERTRYRLKTAIRHNHASGHFGPWQARYRALCTPHSAEVTP